MIISGLTLHTENASLPHASIVLENDRIKTISASPSNAQDAIHFPAEYHLVPGMIDLHIHGIAGADVMDATPDALSTLCRHLPEEGTTAFLATTMTQSSAAIESALVNIQRFMSSSRPDGAELLGIHLEGPFLSAKKTGAQSEQYLQKPQTDLLRQWQALSANTIRQVTFAPEECTDPEFIPWLKRHGILAAMGHTNATFNEANEAIHAGCHHAAHLFNAMTGMHHRDPGAALAILLSEDVTAEIIADGIHVHPDMLKFTYTVKGKDRLVLVTDAMRAKCLAAGPYELGGQPVMVANGAARLLDGTLAGSVLRMLDAANNMRKFTGCSLQDVMQMTAVNPAKLLGLFHRKGSLSEGKDADLLVLNENFEIIMTLCRGKVVFSQAAADITTNARIPSC